MDYILKFVALLKAKRYLNYKGVKKACISIELLLLWPSFIYRTPLFCSEKGDEHQ